MAGIRRSGPSVSARLKAWSSVPCDVKVSVGSVIVSPTGRCRLPPLTVSVGPAVAVRVNSIVALRTFNAGGPIRRAEMPAATVPFVASSNESSAIGLGSPATPSPPAPLSRSRNTPASRSKRNIGPVTSIEYPPIPSAVSAGSATPKSPSVATSKAGTVTTGVIPAIDRLAAPMRSSVPAPAGADEQLDRREADGEGSDGERVGVGRGGERPVARDRDGRAA